MKGRGGDLWLNCQREEGKGVEVELSEGRGGVGRPTLEKNSAHGHPYSAPILVCTVTPWCSSFVADCKYKGGNRL